MCVVKIEVKMRKCEGLQWAVLEGSEEQNSHQKLPQMADAKGDLLIVWPFIRIRHRLSFLTHTTLLTW